MDLSHRLIHKSKLGAFEQRGASSQSIDLPFCRAKIKEGDSAKYKLLMHLSVSFPERNLFEYVRQNCKQYPSYTICSSKIFAWLPACRHFHCFFVANVCIYSRCIFHMHECTLSRVSLKGIAPPINSKFDRQIPCSSKCSVRQGVLHIFMEMNPQPRKGNFFQTH